MRKLLLIAALLTLHTTVPAQISEDNTGNKIRIRKAESTNVAVELIKMNVLYAGIDNPLQVYSRNNSNALNLTLSQGTVSGGNGYYLARVTTPGIAELSIFEGKKLVGTKSYRVKLVPDPTPEVGGLRGGPIPKEVLIAAPAVIAVMDNFDYELYYRVLSFKLTFYRKGKDPIIISSESNLITSAMREILASTRVGDRVYFEYIRAVAPDGGVRRLPSINFTMQ